MSRGVFRIFRCAIAGIQAIQAHSSHTFSRHTHDQFGIGLMARGAQKSASGRGLVEACAGDVITCNPGEVHDGVPIGPAPRSWTMLYLDPQLVATFMADITDGRKGACELPRPVVRDGPTAQRLGRLCSALTSSGLPAGPVLIDEQLLLLLAGLQDDAARPGSRPAAPAAVARARQCIDDDPAAPVTLAELACHSGLSRFQLVRGFAKATGLTPHAYLLQRRVHLARRLITQGLPLRDAAADSGFADQSHMTRLFVRNYGVSPGAYAAAVR
jgi:AraC-like DNA-binding protein